MHGVNQIAHAAQLELGVITSSIRQGADQPNARSKQRKVDRACDACRRRKTRCDGPRMVNNVCSNCLQLGKHCTYVEASKPRGPPKAYITGLEDRMEMLEALLERLQPGVDYSNELGSPVIRDSWKTEGTLPAPPKSAKLGSSSPLDGQRSFSSIRLRPVGTNSHDLPPFVPYRRHPSSPPPLVGSAPGSVGLSNYLPFSPEQLRKQSPPTLPPIRERPEEVSYDSSSDDDSSSEVEAFTEVYTGQVKRLTLQGIRDSVVDAADHHLRFHGKSSAVGLVDATRRFKQMHILGRMEDTQDKKIEPSPPPQNLRRRVEFWVAPRWELVYEGLHADAPEVLSEFLEKFPPDDLASSLIELHFKHVNPHYPLLHRPTFERQWAQKLHHRDLWYACLCLSLFGVASRWSDDPRVLLDDVDTSSEKADTNWSSAGWKYFAASIDIHRMRRSLMYPATLFEIQAFTLLAMFLRGTSSPSSAWIVVTIGIRKAQDTGAFRKGTYQDEPSIHEELWKRAVWCLIIWDRIGSTGLGRGCSLNEEDFDLDLPLEVNDEYWEAKEGRPPFQQPPDVPSTVKSFNLFINLTRILSFVLKTIYTVNKNKVYYGGFSQDWQVELLSQLDRAMKDWRASVPEHLTWSEQNDDFYFSNQATTLWTGYYLTQMNIYRPFIPKPQYVVDHPYYLPSTRGISDKALKICTEAAQSLARMVDVQRKRGYTNTANMCTVAHMAAGMLSWSVWDLKVQERAAASEDSKAKICHRIDTYLRDITICTDALEWLERRWPVVTPLLDKLRESLPSEVDQVIEPPLLFAPESTVLPYSMSSGRVESGGKHPDSIYTYGGHENQSWRPPPTQSEWQWQAMTDPSNSARYKGPGGQYPREASRIGQPQTWPSPYDARPDPATYLERELSKLHSFSDTRLPDSQSPYAITSQETWAASSSENLRSFPDRPFPPNAPSNNVAATASASTRDPPVLYISDSMRRTSFPTTGMRYQPLGSGISDVLPTTTPRPPEYEDANMHHHEQYYHDNHQHVAKYRDHHPQNTPRVYAPMSIQVPVNRSADPAMVPATIGVFDKSVQRSGTASIITPSTPTWEGGPTSRTASTSAAVLGGDYPLRSAYQSQSQYPPPPLAPPSAVPVPVTPSTEAWPPSPYTAQTPTSYPPQAPSYISTYPQREPHDSYGRPAYNTNAAQNYTLYRSSQ